MTRNKRRRDDETTRKNESDQRLNRAETRKSARNANGGATRRFRAFFECGLAATTTATIFCAPEGAIREGDFLPVALCFGLFAVAAFGFAFRSNFPIAVKNSDLNPNDKSDWKNEDADEGCAIENFQIGRKTQRVEKKRFSLSSFADWSLLVFLAWAIASFGKLVLTESGDVRQSTNALWTFATPTLLYFFVRYFKTLFDRRLTANVAVLLIACAAAESAFAAYSYFVANPRLRAEYRADPDGMLAANGMTLAPGSRERLLFEKRLLESSEPTGTFALANSLAGLLAPTFVLTLVLSGGVWLSRREKGKTNEVGNVVVDGVWIATLCFVAFALVATKSRAGYLATFFGVAVCGAFATVAAWRRGRSAARRTILTLVGAAFVGVVVLGAAFATGILDARVFSEAGKSLGYRLDYWRASAAIVRDFPWFGIGPGEFQNVYPRYVAASASEFVADPHHFAFELAALFGIPALVAFGAFLTAVFVASTRRTEESQPVVNQGVEDGATISNRPFFVGAFCGIALAFCCSAFQTAPLDATFAATAFGVFAVVLPSASRFLRGVGADVANVAAVSALAAATLNLCAAGGIGYPAVSAPIFLLAAFVLNRREKSGRSVNALIEQTCGDKRVDVAKRSTAFLVAAAIFVVFYSTAFRPRNDEFFFKIRVATPDGAAVYRDSFESGAPEKVDGRSATVVARHYYFAANEFFARPNPQNETRWKTLREKVLRVSPNSATNRENCGDFDFALFEKNETRREFLDSALDFYRGAVENSPTETGKRAKLVRALNAAGKLDEARKEAKIALELDAQTPHLDRKLSAERRAELERLER